MRVHVIHGIRTAGASQAPRALLPYLAQSYSDVVYVDYGYLPSIGSRQVNEFIVGALLDYMNEGDLFVGHSNGCAIGHELAKAGALFHGMVFINAALEPDIELMPYVKWVDVYYNAGDEITEAAQIAADLHLEDAVWGEMGHSGYSGNDPRITNVNCGANPPLPVVAGHSDIFTNKISEWGPAIVKRMLAHP